MIPSIIEVEQLVDDRGITKTITMDFSRIKSVTQIDNHRVGFIRAWNGSREHDKYLYVVSGTVLVGTVCMDTGEERSFIIGDNVPEVLHIPAGHYLGFKTLSESHILLLSDSEDITDDEHVEWDTWNMWDDDYR